MITHEPVLEIEKSEDLEQSGFGIEVNANSFRILSKNIYSNQIRAIVRELGTNAFDSHVCAGKGDKEFQVHLPNSMEPFFYIRDWGTGLRIDELVNEVKTLYTVYFKSNKTSRNDLTGCLGLGSKSPFGYTDNLSVVNWYNGKKFTYSCFIGEKGCPDIAKMDEEDTDEPNGLEVKFAVKPSDFHRFREEARFVYQHFANRPQIVGATVEYDHTLPAYESTKNGRTWKLFDTDKYSHKVIMGNVSYPLNLTEADCNHELFKGYRIELNVNIGDVDMTASRESLEYTDKTKAVIKELTGQAVAVFAVQIVEKLQACPTYWNACIFHHLNQLWLPANCEWNGRKTGRTIYLDKTFNVDTYELGYNNKVHVKRAYEHTKLDAGNVYKFVINDLKDGRGIQNRMYHWLKTKGQRNNRVFVLHMDAATQQEYLDLLGLPADMIIKASALEKPVSVRQTAQRCYKFKDDKHTRRQKNMWEPHVADANEETIYIEMDHWGVKEIGNAERLKELLTYHKQVTGKNITLVGVRKTLAKKVAGFATWKKLEDVLEAVYQQYIANLDVIYSNSYYQTWTQAASYLKGKITNKKVIEFFDKVDEAAKNYGKYTNIRYLFSTMRKDVTPKEPADVKWMTETFPLVSCIVKSVNLRDWPQDEMAKSLDSVQN